jgi:UDP-2,4-diacetamido-2,4,6-trideoxy-beta-L-altropyranose hydrolase
MNLVFRVDAAKSIGAGHLVRCINLAQALSERGAEIRFVCRDSTEQIFGQILGIKFEVIVLPNGSGQSVSQLQDARETIQAMNGRAPDWLIVDSYELDVTWESMLRPYVANIMVIEDQPNRRHDCDLLLDQNYSVADRDRYAEWVPQQCKMLLGPEYALLPRKFWKAREQQTGKTGRLDKLLIFFTAGIDQHETLKAMHGVAQFGGAASVDVVIGSANEDKEEIAAMCREQGWGYHCQVDYMHELLANMDLVIGSGGISNWERCVLGIPALVAVLADNQSTIANDLANAGAIINMGRSVEISADDYSRELSTLRSEKLLSMSKFARQLVDGMGLNRVIQEIYSNKIMFKSRNKYAKT